MDEYVNFTRCVTAGFCVLVVSVTSYKAHQNQLETAVIAKAANPAQAACAFAEPDRQKSAFCVEVSRQK